MRTLTELQAARLQVNFDDEVERAKDTEIDAMERRITKLLRSSENDLKRIAMLPSSGSQTISQEEKVQRLPC